jgi:hypothetical protein
MFDGLFRLPILRTTSVSVYLVKGDGLTTNTQVRLRNKSVSQSSAEDIFELTELRDYY